MAAFLMLLICATGCGANSGPIRYAISGTVTYDGDPVPAGEIVFEPNGAKGNKGPSATAEIRDGEYSLSADKGIVGGPSVVRVTGLDGKPPPGPEAQMAPLGMQLFPPYRAEIDLPKAETNEDIEIPKPR